MTQNTDYSDVKSSRLSAFLRSTGTSLILPVAITVIGLIIEYKFFQSKHTDSENNHTRFISLLLTTSSLVWLFISIRSTITMWIKPNNYFREQFSFNALVSLIISAIHVIISVFNGYSIFNLISSWMEFTLNRSIPSPEIRIGEISSLILGLILLYIFLGFLHQRWRGNLSSEQFRREQTGRASHVFYESMDEFLRIIGQRPALKPYRDTRFQNNAIIVEPIDESLAWKDQAYDLITLSNSSYRINKTEGWHNPPGCWVGNNIHTNDLIIIFPIQSSPIEADIQEIVLYTERILGTNDSGHGRIYIVWKGREFRTSYAYQKKDNVSILFLNEDQLLDNLVNFDDYKNDIDRRVRDITETDAQFPLISTYITPTITNQQSGQILGDLDSFLLNWLREPKLRPLSILGEYGQGKSSAARMLTYRLLNDIPDIERIPILIELRGKALSNSTPRELLGAWAQEYNLNGRAIWKLHLAGRLLIIFDGFDEMDRLGNLETRLRHFATIGQFAVSQAKLIITGRPSLFEGKDELESALGLSNPFGSTSGALALRLEFFDLDKIAKSLVPYPELIRNQILDLARERKTFYDIVSRPSLLHIVASLWEKEELALQVADLTSAYVVGLFIRQIYERQTRKESASTNFMFLNDEERAYFMNGIASYMISYNLPNQINLVRLNTAIALLTENIPINLSSGGSVFKGQKRMPLQERINEIPDGIEYVQTDVRTYGIISEDPASPSTYKFGHKSFMEFLCAETVALSRLGSQEEMEKAETIMNSVSLRVYEIVRQLVLADFFAEIIAFHIKTKLGETNRNDLIKKIPGEVFNVIEKPVVFTDRLALFTECFVRSMIYSIRDTKRMKRFIIITSPYIGVFILLHLIKFFSNSEILQIISFIDAAIFSVLFLSIMVIATSRSSSRQKAHVQPACRSW